MFGLIHGEINDPDRMFLAGIVLGSIGATTLIRCAFPSSLVSLKGSQKQRPCFSTKTSNVSQKSAITCLLLDSKHKVRNIHCFWPPFVPAIVSFMK